jgi:hypothetical protein
MTLARRELKGRLQIRRKADEMVEPAVIVGCGAISQAGLIFWRSGRHEEG